MAKFRKHPSGEWPGFPFLKREDISHEYFKEHAKYVAQGLVENRKGHVTVKMDGEDYLRFLEAVRKKYGNIWSSNIDRAMQEALELFLKEAGI